MITKLGALLATLCLLAPVTAVSQEEALPPPASPDFGLTLLSGGILEPIPAVDSIASDWEARFSTGEARADFGLLRAYRSEKQAMLAEQRALAESFGAYRQASEWEGSEKARYSRVIQVALRSAAPDAAFANVSVPLPLGYDDILGAGTPGEVPVEDLNRLLGELALEDTLVRAYLGNLAVANSRILSNIRTIETDLRKGEAAIDFALTPEDRSMKFRIWISGFFSILIAIMIVSFFTIIYRRADQGVVSLLLSDGGLQFVTIFVLIIAIILFGILNILEGRELAAILSGIAGYILGRGASMKKGSDEGQTSPPAAEPSGAGVPAPIQFRGISQPDRTPVAAGVDGQDQPFEGDASEGKTRSEESEREG